MDRVPVHMTDAAREAIYTSGQEGAVFPQALGEAFAEADLDVEVFLDVVLKSEHFVAEVDAAQQLLQTRVEPHHDVPDRGHYVPPFIQLTNMSDLFELRMGGRLGFHAVRTARELVRLYRQYYRI